MLDSFRVRLASLGPVMFRIALGCVFIFHGRSKMADLFDHINPIAKALPANAPFPILLGWLAGTTEFVGGICVLIGLLTRFWSAGLVIQMTVAIALVHGSHGFAANKGGYEYPFALGLTALGLFLMGPGPLSLDYLIGRLIRGGKANAVVGCGTQYPAKCHPADAPADAGK